MSPVIAVICNLNPEVAYSNLGVRFFNRHLADSP
jgi:hypothetical protein